MTKIKKIRKLAKDSIGISIRIGILLFFTLWALFIQSDIDNARKVEEAFAKYQNIVYAKKATKYDVDEPTPEEMLELINKDRKKIGVKPLKLDPALNKLAQMKADHMSRYNYYSHNIPEKYYDDSGMDMITKDMKYWYDRNCDEYLSENIYKADLRPFFTSQEVHNGFANSKDHREGYLDSRHDLLGIGINIEDKIIVEHFCVDAGRLK